MKKLLALSLLLVAGCVTSWNPLYTEKDLVFDPQLVGTWKADEGELWKFEKDAEKEYKLTYTDKEGTAVFEAHLLKIKDREFLDIYLKDELKLNSLATITLIPTHLFFRVDEIGTSLKMAVVDDSWVRNHLGANPKAIAHLMQEEHRPMFTAETKDLQAFVLKHADGKGLFEKPFVLNKESTK
jgi:hypothetical protein